MTIMQPDATPAAPRLDVVQAGGHLDLMIRQTRIHHMTLSITADTKANMLMIAASVVLTLAARDMVGGKAPLPALILTVFSLASVCMAIIAAMPKLGFGRKELASRNILFFSTFTRLSYEQYLREMEDVMRSPASTYEMQLCEIYEMGQYLKRHKFRFVQAGYLIFLAGLFLSAFAWVVQALS
ncbi:MAG TPA: Pycsar system effector family protein [Solimonas sp.]|nr:Pycsar system effector family protein [Solimonas sp.]